MTPIRSVSPSLRESARAGKVDIGHPLKRLERSARGRGAIKKREKECGSARKHPCAAGSALSSQAGATIGFAWLFVVLAASHLFLDAAALNQLTKSTDCFLNCFPVANH